MNLGTIQNRCVMVRSRPTTQINIDCRGWTYGVASLRDTGKTRDENDRKVKPVREARRVLEAWRTPAE